MNTRQLQYFISAASYLNFTRAAEEHYISQTAITQQIKNLEDILGTQLFYREKRNVSLTPAGKVFFNEAKAILERINTAIERTAIAAKGASGSLKIGIVSGFEKTPYFSDLMHRFHSMYPNVQLDFSRGRVEKLYNDLGEGIFDIIFDLEFKDCMKDSFNAVTAQNYNYVAALYVNHPFAQRKTLKRKDLKDESFLEIKEISNSPWNEIMENYRRVGYIPHVVQLAEDFDTLLLMVAAELGIGVMPSYVASHLSSVKSIVFIPLEGDFETINMNAIWRKDSTNESIEQLLAQI